MMWLVLTILALSSTSQLLVKAEKCVTPNNEEAECVSLYSCPMLVKVMLDPSSREFVKKSTCGGTVMEPMVCCGTSSNFTAPPEKPKVKVSTKGIFNIKNIIASKAICGFQHSDDYLHSEAGSVALSQFPWVALIEYRLRNDTNVIPPEGKYQCTGSIINQKYVLTGAQCLTDEKILPVSVRLGEYDLRNDTDCKLESRLLECADATIDYPIEKFIVHPEYSDSDFSNDIGLIRIKGRAKYTDYIRPICLHALKKKRRVQPGDTLITSGWGKKGDTDPDYVQIKKVTYSTLITNEECSKRFGSMAQIEDTFMCGVLQENSDNLCHGDSGGPVMFHRKSQWYQVALVSAGVGCMKDYPIVFTRVDAYLNWIKETVKP